jgi:hypothetical protein
MRTGHCVVSYGRVGRSSACRHASQMRTVGVLSWERQRSCVAANSIPQRLHGNGVTLNLRPPRVRVSC